MRIGISLAIDAVRGLAAIVAAIRHRITSSGDFRVTSTGDFRIRG